MPVGIETILVQRYEVLNVKTQESESFFSWDAAEQFYDKQCGGALVTYVLCR